MIEASDGLLRTRQLSVDNFQEKEQKWPPGFPGSAQRLTATEAQTDLSLQLCGLGTNQTFWRVEEPSLKTCKWEQMF